MGVGAGFCMYEYDVCMYVCMYVCMCMYRSGRGPAYTVDPYAEAFI